MAAQKNKSVEAYSYSELDMFCAKGPHVIKITIPGKYQDKIQKQPGWIYTFFQKGFCPTIPTQEKPFNKELHLQDAWKFQEE